MMHSKKPARRSCRLPNPTGVRPLRKHPPAGDGKVPKLAVGNKAEAGVRTAHLREPFPGTGEKQLEMFNAGEFGIFEQQACAHLYGGAFAGPISATYLHDRPRKRPGSEKALGRIWGQRRLAKTQSGPSYKITCRRLSTVSFGRGRIADLKMSRVRTILDRDEFAINITLIDDANDASIRNRRNFDHGFTMSRIRKSCFFHP